MWIIMSRLIELLFNVVSVQVSQNYKIFSGQWYTLDLKQVF